MASESVYDLAFEGPAVLTAVAKRARIGRANFMIDVSGAGMLSLLSVLYVDAGEKNEKKK